jgi:hypothetical protein
MHHSARLQCVPDPLWPVAVHRRCCLSALFHFNNSTTVEFEVHLQHVTTKELPASAQAHNLILQASCKRTCDASRILGGLSLCVIEVGWHSHHRLADAVAQERLCGTAAAAAEGTPAKVQGTVRGGWKSPMMAKFFR